MQFVFKSSWFGFELQQMQTKNVLNSVIVLTICKQRIVFTYISSPHNQNSLWRFAGPHGLCNRMNLRCWQVNKKLKERCGAHAVIYFWCILIIHDLTPCIIFHHSLLTRHRSSSMWTSVCALQGGKKRLFEHKETSKGQNVQFIKNRRFCCSYDSTAFSFSFICVCLSSYLLEYFQQENFTYSKAAVNHQWWEKTHTNTNTVTTRNIYEYIQRLSRT